MYNVVAYTSQKNLHVKDYIIIQLKNVIFIFKLIDAILVITKINVLTRINVYKKFEKNLINLIFILYNYNYISFYEQ